MIGEDLSESTQAVTSYANSFDHGPQLLALHEHPIADFFPYCTILFADILGFYGMVLFQGTQQSFLSSPNALLGI